MGTHQSSCFDRCCLAKRCLTSRSFALKWLLQNYRISAVNVVSSGLRRTHVGGRARDVRFETGAGIQTADRNIPQVRVTNVDDNTKLVCVCVCVCVYLCVYVCVCVCMCVCPRHSSCSTLKSSTCKCHFHVHLKNFSTIKCKEIDSFADFNCHFLPEWKQIPAGTLSVRLN